MAPLNLNAKKYVISTAFAATLALTPVVGSSVFASAGEGSSDGDISYEESNLPEINEELSSEEQPAAVVNSSLIQQGSSGPEVENIQSLLQNQGHLTSSVDGIFGDLTEQAVKDFQSAQGLQADGIVGPDTANALGTPVESESSSEEVIVENVDNSNDAGTGEETAVVPSQSNASVVAAAESLLGIPYQYGAYSPGNSNPSALDSSGFINQTFDQVGISVSRTHSDMWANDGVHVDSPDVGDVVFFEGTYDTNGASHSGVYIGNNQMIHAGTEGVAVADMSIDYWQSHYIGAKSFTQ